MSTKVDKLTRLIQQHTEESQPQEDPAHIKELNRKRELLKKIRAKGEDQIRHRLRVFTKDGSPLDASKHYLWSNRNEHRIANWEGWGYVICRDPNIVTKFPRREDGTFVIGDLILMEGPEEEREARKLESEIRAYEGLDAERVFEAFAETHGIPTHRPRT